MHRLKGAVLLSLFLGLATQAGAECWEWQNRGSKGAPVCAQFCWPAFFTYDENSQKLALANNLQDGTVELWTYDGQNWEKVWASVPEAPGGFHFSYALGFYFDQNLNSLVLMSNMMGGAQGEFCQGFQRFVPGQGWKLLFPCFDFVGASQVVFDSVRKRAVITGAYSDYQGRNPITVEYDGQAFYKISNPPEFTFGIGILGFNPESGKTVFFGQTQDGGSFGTYEYDGNAWIKADTSTAPPNFDMYTIGMPYIPGFHGLIYVPGDLNSLKSWLFKDHQWSLLSIISSPPGHIDGIFGYNAIKNEAILFSWDLVSNQYDVFALGLHNHCRPISKP